MNPWHTQSHNSHYLNAIIFRTKITISQRNNFIEIIWMVYYMYFNTFINCLVHSVVHFFFAVVVPAVVAAVVVPSSLFFRNFSRSKIFCAHTRATRASTINTFSFVLFRFQAKTTRSKMVWKIDKIEHTDAGTSHSKWNWVRQKCPQNWWLYQGSILWYIFFASLYIVLQVLAGVCIELCVCVYAFILFTMVRLNKMEKNYEFQIWKCFIFHRSIVHSLIYCNAVQQDKGMFQQK